MRIDFKASFARDLKRIRNAELLGQVEEVIVAAERAQAPTDIPNLKKLRVKGNYYRVKLGNYRIGLTIEGDAVAFVRLLHRSEVYRYFP